MDADRQIRLLIAPFFFYVVLISAWVLSREESLLVILKEIDKLKLIGVLSLITLSTIPLGYFLSGILVSSVQTVFSYKKKGFPHDISDPELDKIKKVILNSKNIKYDFENKNNHIIVLEQGVIYNEYEGIYKFQVRAYNSYIIASSSMLAIGLAFVLTLALAIYPPPIWWILTILLFSCLRFMKHFSINNNRTLLKFLINEDFIQNKVNSKECKEEYYFF